jgi:type II secretion system protein G
MNEKEQFEAGKEGFPRPWGKQLIRRRKRSTGYGGFTLIEIAIVLAIVGILATIAVPSYTAYLNRSRNNIAIRNIRLLEHAIKLYELENLRLPNSLNELGPVSLLDLDGRTIRQSPPFLDSWNQPFRYLNLLTEPPGMPNARRDGHDKPLSLDYDLYSVGADGATNKKLDHSKSLDDVVRARSGAFVDLASKY